MSAASSPAPQRVGFGPGLLVAAAFIGPGTVVSASKAGAAHGCQLLWTIVFAVAGAVALQYFAARLGILSGRGLGERIQQLLQDSPFLRPTIALVVAAIGIGNAAYQTGNLSGAATGLAAVAGGETSTWVVVLGATTLVLLALGHYAWLQRVLIGMVVVLSLAFLVSASQSLPAAGRLLRGALAPQVTVENLTLVLALIGTTIVPYNLFLHASSAAENWRGVEPQIALRQAWWDTLLSILLGGLVTAAIMVTASTAFFDQGKSLTSASEIATQLRPTLGPLSSAAFSIGLFAAGLTSAITAPLATAFALAGVLGWPTELQSWRFRGVAFLVVIAGVTCAVVWGATPAKTIVFAQVANGLLLPIIAWLLMWSATVHSRRFPTAWWTIAVGWLVTLLVSALAGWKVIQALV